MPGIEPDRSKHLSVWGAFPLLLGGSVSGYGFWLQVCRSTSTVTT